MKPGIMLRTGNYLCVFFTLTFVAMQSYTRSQQQDNVLAGLQHYEVMRFEMVVPCTVT